MYVTPCQTPGVDPETFFPVDERADSPGVARAVALCGGCAVRDACLAWALAHPAETAAGVWGGLTTGQRRELLAAQPRWVVTQPDRPAPTGRPRARCLACGNRQHVRADGTLGHHHRVDLVRGRALPCTGSGDPAPAVSAEAAG